ncbi:hypothetical protein EC988_004729 [Linderina pennispora]|nr:hypothetical protein EC988_004729 [Linderina pennispora]
MSAPNSPNQYIPLGERASSVPPHPQLAERSPVATPQPTDRNLEEPDEVDDAMDRDGGGDDDNDSNYVDEEAMLEEAAETLGFRVAVRRHSQQDLLDMADFLLTFIYLYTFLVDKSIVNAMVRYVASITAMYPRTNYGVGVALSVMALANSLSIARHISMGLSQHGFDATGALVDFIGCSSPHLVLVLLVDLFALFIEFVRVFAYSPMHFAKARTARVLALILAAERADDIVSALAEQIGEGSGSDTATPEQMAAATGNEDDQRIETPVC